MTTAATPARPGATRNLVVATVGCTVNFWAWRCSARSPRA